MGNDKNVKNYSDLYRMRSAFSVIDLISAIRVADDR
jgi:hypothetical protein